MSLKEQTQNWLVDEVSLSNQQASQIMKFLAGEVASIKALDTELSVQSLFLDQVEADRRDLQQRDLQNVVANAGEVVIKDDKVERLALYDELRSRGFGKSLVVVDKNKRFHWYRISQANWTVKCGDSYVINRLAPLAGLLVSAKVGDELELPQIGEVEVVAERLLSGWNHIQRDIHQCINTDDATDLKPQTVSGGHRLVKQWIESAESLAISLTKQKTKHITEDHTSELTSQALMGGEDEAMLQDRMELFDSEMDPFREQSLAADFYTRTTHEQEELIRQPKSGIVAVEGVAGSGKTSVGLGRLKALHDAQFSHPDSDEFSDFFNDKTQMRAFVLSPQLKGYLKKTLDELHLTNLPISDFEEFRKQLLSHHAGLLGLKVPGVVSKNSRYSLCRAITSESCYGYDWLKTLDHALVVGMRDEIIEKMEWFENRDLNVLPSRKEGGQVLNFQLLISDWLAETKIGIERIFDRKRKSKDLSCMHLGRDLESLLRERTQYTQKNSIWYFNPEQQKWTVKRALNDINAIEAKPWSDSGFGPELTDRIKKVRRRLMSRLRDVLLLDAAGFKGVPFYIEKGSYAFVGHQDIESSIAQLNERLASAKLSSTDVDAMLVLSEALCATAARSIVQDDRSVDLYRASPRYSAVFIDEVQDFSEVQVLLMSLMADPRRNCVTVVGDFCQQLSQRRIRDLNNCFLGRGESPIRPFKLLENKRQRKNLASFSLYIRSKIESGLSDLPPYIETKGELEKLDLSECDWVDWLTEELGNIHPKKSVAVIFPSQSLAKNAFREFESDSLSFRDVQLSLDGRDLTKAFTAHFTTPLPSKGLEFDVVIAPYFNLFDFNDPVSANAAYVTVSRPRERLITIDIK